MAENRTPAQLIPPGRILRKELEARGWTQKDLAAVIGRPEQTISAIIRGTKQITPETAIALGKALGTSAQLWMNLESNYRLRKASQMAQEGEIERRRRLYEMVPVRELVRRGWIRERPSIDDMESEVRTFLGIKHIDEEPKLAASFRGTEGKLADTPSCLAWLKRVENLVKHSQLPKYSEERLLAEGIPALQALTTELPRVGSVSPTLASLGIAFTCVPHLPKTYLDGATFQLPTGIPVIALTLRHDRIDAFWFTLFHELTHLVFDHGRAFLDRMSKTDESTRDEIAANQRAAAWLIPPRAFERFVKSQHPYFSERAILAFAGNIRRHPGIVLGRLQRAGLVPYRNLRKLLPRVSSYLAI